MKPWLTNASHLGVVCSLLAKANWLIPPPEQCGVKGLARGLIGGQVLSWPHQGLNHRPSRSQKRTARLQICCKASERHAHPDENLERVDAVVHCPLDVIHPVVCGSADNQRGDGAVLLVCRQIKKKKKKTLSKATQLIRLRWGQSPWSSAGWRALLKGPTSALIISSSRSLSQ